ncbi:MAG: sigma-70 family RNA polymerase sigma factor, partial [Prevotellaceae bacterium]|nr:sigma-70 family RNA polymerase sigma factor [Candidatus Colivivens equi]
MEDNENMSFAQIQENDRQTIEKICSDGNYAYYFFHTKCRPLLSNIVWTLYKSSAEYDELVNTLFEYLKAPGKDGEFWHKLRSFDYRTSLFDWIKIVAVRLFYTPDSEKFSIPDSLISSGVAEDMFSELPKAIHRKYMLFKYIDNLSDKEISSKLKMELNEIRSISRAAIRSLKKVVESSYSDYLSVLFQKDVVSKVDSEESENEFPSKDLTIQQDAKIDVYTYLDLMPNERYRYVIKSLFLEDKDPDDLAIELNTPISNIYNIKSRGLDQLRDIAIYN